MTQQKTPKEKKQGKRLKTYALFSSLIIQMIGIIAVGTFIGIKLDEKYPYKPNFFKLIFALSSVIFSIVYVIKRIITISKSDL